MKIELVLFLSFFSKLRIRVLEGHFQCVHTIRLSEPTKIGSLKTDRVNGPLNIEIGKQLERSSGNPVDPFYWIFAWKILKRSEINQTLVTIEEHRWLSRTLLLLP